MPAEKIMIVDDERLVRWSLRQKCEEWGYLVVEADAGEAVPASGAHEAAAGLAGDKDQPTESKRQHGAKR